MTLLIPLYVSRTLQAFYASACLMAFLALWLADPPLYLHVFSVLLCLVNVGRYLRQERPKGLMLNDSEVFLSFARRRVAVRLHRYCYCSRYLVVIGLSEIRDIARLGLGRREHILILLPDSCPASLHRQLRVALRWHSFDARVLRS